MRRVRYSCAGVVLLVWSICVCVCVNQVLAMYIIFEMYLKYYILCICIHYYGSVNLQTSVGPCVYVRSRALILGSCFCITYNIYWCVNKGATFRS